MNLKQWQRSKKIKAEAEAAAKRTIERVLNAVKEQAMSEFKECNHTYQYCWIYKAYLCIHCDKMRIKDED